MAGGKCFFPVIALIIYSSDISEYNFGWICGRRGMKSSFIVMMLCVFLIVPFASADQTVPSQIKEVTLFAGQALVEREASATVQKGLNELLIEVQAFRVDKDSVMARVFGQGEIFSVQFKEIPLKEPPQENRSPVLESFSVVIADGEVLFSAVASDPEGDDLTYNFGVQGGGVSGWISDSGWATNDYNKDSDEIICHVYVQDSNNNLVQHSKRVRVE